MLLHCIVLAFCSTIDSLGIGITYGIKNTKMLLSSKIILFLCSFTITLLAVLLGNTLNIILYDNITNILGSIILIFIGCFLMFSSFKEKNNFDIDYSNYIDNKESLFLGIALSIDSFGIGLSSSMVKLDMLLLPTFIPIFQFLFLSFGFLLGKRIKQRSHIPDNVWSIIPGILLIIIGILKVLY